MQYAKALQYVSYKTDDQYYHQISPPVECFWVRVILPFNNHKLNELMDEEFLADNMISSCSCPAPDYGVKHHITFVYESFFEDVET